MGKKVAFIGILLILLVPLARASETNPVKIGAILPLTGELASWGASEKAGIVLAFEEVKWRVAGRPIKFVYYDDKSLDATKGLEAARRLVESDHVDMILGPTVSGVFMSVHPYLEKHKILHSCLNYRGQHLDWVRPRWDITGGTVAQIAYPAGRWAVKHGIRSVSTMAHDYETGWQAIGGFAKSFVSSGGKILQQQWVPWGTMDFAPYLANLKRADALVWWWIGAGVPPWIEQYKELGWFKKMPMLIIEPDLEAEPALVKCGSAAVNTKAIAMWHSSIDSIENRKFVSFAKSELGRDPDVQVYEAYERAKVFLAIIKATGGDTTPEVMRNALMKLRVKTPTGVVAYTNKGWPVRNMFMLNFEEIGGKYGFKVIETFRECKSPGYFRKGYGYLVR